MKNFKIELSNGILIFILIGFYFFLMEALNLSDQFILRTLNIFIIVYGVRRTILAKMQKGETNYFNNLISGSIASLIGVFLSIIALYFYLTLVNPENYLNELAGAVFVFDSTISPFEYCVALAIEGVASSVMVSFILMQYYKAYTPKNTSVN